MRDTGHVEVCSKVRITAGVRVQGRGQGYSVGQGIEHGEGLINAQACVGADLVLKWMRRRAPLSMTVATVVVSDSSCC